MTIPYGPTVTAGHDQAGSDTPEDGILLKPEVLRIVQLSDTTLWRMEREGGFPKRLAIGRGRRVGWIRSEVFAWLREQAEHSRAALKPLTRQA